MKKFCGEIDLKFKLNWRNINRNIRKDIPQSLVHFGSLYRAFELHSTNYVLKRSRKKMIVAKAYRWIRVSVYFLIGIGETQVGHMKRRHIVTSTEISQVPTLRKFLCIVRLICYLTDLIVRFTLKNLLWLLFTIL